MNSIIEIGNMKYNVGGGCKKYHDFKNTFGHDSDTEYILRKYMIPKRPHFDPPSDKDKLIKKIFENLDLFLLLVPLLLLLPLPLLTCLSNLVLSLSNLMIIEWTLF